MDWQSYSLPTNNQFFSNFYQIYLDKTKTKLIIRTAPSYSASPEILESNHFKIQAAQLPPEELEYFTLCK